MTTIKLTIEPIARNYQSGMQTFTTVHEFAKYVYINGYKFLLCDFFSTIGNNEIVKFSEILPIQKSTSDKKKIEFISKYANNFLSIKQL